MLKRGKRGQFTLFIIIGIVLLLVVVLALVIRNIVVEERIEEAQRIVEEVPLEFNPLKTFTEDCLKVTAEQGIVQLGQRGGYINPKQWHGLFFDETNPTDADGLTFAGSSADVPYWIYNKAPNSGNVITLASLRPTLPQMESDVKRWVEQEVGNCLDSYRAFKEQGFDVTEGETTATVTIAPGAVRIALDHPLQVKHAGTESTPRHFFVEIPVDLLHAYDIASKIMLAQQNASFLEKNTLSLITLFSGPTPSQLPPMTESTFEFANTVTWREDKVKQDIKTLLANYVPLLRFQGASNFFNYEYPVGVSYRDTKQRIYNNMILPLSGAEDVEVRFNYLDTWEPYLDVNAEGGIIQPQSASVSFAGMSLGVQRFKTVYDISYPVWISLYDPAAFDNRGFFFNFALEANVRNNRPVAAEQTLLPTVSRFTDSLLCNLNQRTSGDITVIAQEAATLEPVPGVAVSYSLGEETCPVGTTDENGLLVAKFPVAIGGVVHLAHSDYGRTAQYLDTETGKDDVVVGDLWKYQIINVNVQKKKLVKGTPAGALSMPTVTGWNFNGAPHPLRGNEQASVSLRRIAALDEPVSAAAAVTDGDTATLRLVPGTYEVTLVSVLNQRVTIPPEQRKADGQEYWAPGPNPIVFEPFPNGRIQWDSPATYLEIRAGDLYSSGTMTLYVLELPLQDLPEQSRKLEDIEMIGKLGDLSQQYRAQLEPQFS